MVTRKQRAFIEAYLACWNAAEAARRAGYSARSARSIGHENLTKPDIRAEIDRRLAEMTMSADEVLVRLSEQARASMADFLVVDKEGVRLDPRKARKKLHLVKRLRQGKDGLRIELHDAQAALTLLGKRYGLFRELHEHSGPGGGPIEHEVGPVVRIYIPDNGREPVDPDGSGGA